MLFRSDAASLPQLDNNQIADLVEDFDVVSERTSTVRYIGKFNFHFRADAVRQLLEESGVRYAVLTSPPMLVLPVLTADGQSVLWSDANAWFAAWQNHPTGGSLVPVKLPLGDLADMSAIDASQALAGDVAKLLPLATHYGAQTALVVEAKLAADAASGTRQITLAVQRYDAGGLVDSFADEVGGAIDRKSTRLNSSHIQKSRMPSSA